SAPYNFHILNNLATISLERKNYLQADEWLNEALRINPRFEDALYNLSYSKAMQQKYEDALDILDQVPTNSERKKMFRQEIIKLRQNQGQH
ncbi:MAG: tetratricopeptide repeat protein, partial [Saprospiraceae bacterium]|nr:tetratricopeptide repeat protein [Saprospiraceae bacterium]